MKLEFLNDITDRGKFPNAYPKRLIRLYDFGVAEAWLLRQAIERNVLIDETKLSLLVLAFIQPVNCQLTLQLSTLDTGIVQESDKIFTCCLSKQYYREMIVLMEPFCNDDIGGYQWLFEWGTTDSEIEFLFSPHGSW